MKKAPVKHCGPIQPVLTRESCDDEPHHFTILRKGKITRGNGRSVKANVPHTVHPMPQG